jgi:hypothetical protein
MPTQAGLLRPNVTLLPTDRVEKFQIGKLRELQMGAQSISNANAVLQGQRQMLANEQAALDLQNDYIFAAQERAQGLENMRVQAQAQRSAMEIAQQANRRDELNNTIRISDTIATQYGAVMEADNPTQALRETNARLQQQGIPTNLLARNVGSAQMAYAASTEARARAQDELAFMRKNQLMEKQAELQSLAPTQLEKLLNARDRARADGDEDRAEALNQQVLKMNAQPAQASLFTPKTLQMPDGSVQSGVIHKQTGMPMVYDENTGRMKVAPKGTVPTTVSTQRRQEVLGPTREMLPGEFRTYQEMPAEEAKLQMKQDIQVVSELRSTARETAPRMAKIKSFRSALVKTQTGMFAKTKQGALKFAQALGLSTKEGRERIAAAETVESANIDMALDFISRTKGAISDKEFQAFMDAAPGMTRSKQGNKQLLNIMEATAKRAQTRATFYDQYRQRNQTLGGAEEAWGAYTNTNPILDNTGQLQKVDPSAWEKFLDYHNVANELKRRGRL